MSLSSYEQAIVKKACIEALRSNELYLLQEHYYGQDRYVPDEAWEYAGEVIELMAKAIEA